MTCGGHASGKASHAPSPRNTAAASASSAATGACTATRDSTAATTRCMRASASWEHKASAASSVGGFSRCKRGGVAR